MLKNLFKKDDRPLRLLYFNCRLQGGGKLITAMLLEGKGSTWFFNEHLGYFIFTRCESTIEEIHEKLLNTTQIDKEGFYPSWILTEVASKQIGAYFTKMPTDELQKKAGLFSNHSEALRFQETLEKFNTEVEKQIPNCVIDTITKETKS
jgi:transcription elongation factor GreA-like protein